MSNRVHHFKLVLLGDTAVGKSCLVVRFVRDEFFEFQEPTIGGVYSDTCWTLFYWMGLLVSTWGSWKNLEFSVKIFPCFIAQKGQSWPGCLCRISPHLVLLILSDYCVWNLSSQLIFLRFAAAFLTQTVQLDESTVKFEIWDTAGQERYRSLAPMYYR